MATGEAGSLWEKQDETLAKEREALTEGKVLRYGRSYAF